MAEESAWQESELFRTEQPKDIQDMPDPRREIHFDLEQWQQEEEMCIRDSERTVYSVETAKIQHSCDGQKVCGDALEEIWDGRGNVHLLLSDGMGSGSRAALDSAMTFCLLKKLVTAGFSFDSSLELVNAALLVKSEEESLSTVDVATVDLYSGETQFLKAGAAPTFVYRDGSVVKVEAASMPAGILKGVDFAKSRLKLHERCV